MKKYCIVIGDNPELSEQVQLALFEAGFKWRLGGKCVQFTSKTLAIGVNTFKTGEITYSPSGSVIDGMNGATLLSIADILNGGALGLDGAKRVEPRYFLYATGSHTAVVATGNKNSGWMYIESAYKHNELFKWKDHCWDDEDIIILQELTASDVAYIRDNADSAKELGMTFREAMVGDDIISINGEIFIDSCATISFCAGYRYCKKAEPAQDPSKFCHNCAKPVNPVDSNYCSTCGCELVK